MRSRCDSDWCVFDLLRVHKQRMLPVVLSPSEVRAVLDAVRHPVRRMALATIYALGLRLGEGLRLETGHIDAERLVVWVRDGKGARDRGVPLPRPPLARLRHYWKHQRASSPSSYLFVPPDGDVLRRHGPLYLQRHGDAVLPSHARAVQAITQCRTAALGGHLAECTRCASTHLLFHSCRHRASQRCGHDAAQRWLAHQETLLLPVPYFYVVFTLPAELRRAVRSHQRVLLGVLFVAAFESLAALCADSRWLPGRVRVGLRASVVGFVQQAF